MPSGVYKRKPCQQETKEKISKSLRGHVAWNKDKTGIYSKETLEKMSKASKGKPKSANHIINMILSHIGKPSWRKGVKLTDKQRESYSNENHWNWQGGISREPYAVDWTKTLKRAIRERDNYICQICNQYGRCVHHIDNDKKNSDPKNLITLCISCHMTIHNNKKG